MSVELIETSIINQYFSASLKQFYRDTSLRQKETKLMREIGEL